MTKFQTSQWDNFPFKFRTICFFFNTSSTARVQLNSSEGNISVCEHSVQLYSTMWFNYYPNTCGGVCVLCVCVCVWCVCVCVCGVCCVRCVWCVCFCNSSSRGKKIHIHTLDRGIHSALIMPLWSCVCAVKFWVLYFMRVSSAIGPKHLIHTIQIYQAANELWYTLCVCVDCDYRDESGKMWDYSFLSVLNKLNLSSHSPQR